MIIIKISNLGKKKHLTPNTFENLLKLVGPILRNRIEYRYIILRFQIPARTKYSIKGGKPLKIKFLKVNPLTGLFKY